MNSFCKTLFFFFLGIMCVSSNQENQLNFKISYKDSFDKAEKQKIDKWLSEVSLATSNTLGKYPFKVNYYLYKKNSNSEPVPWANTIRNGEQAVNFYVETSFDLEDFKMDWTAAHEIAHLSIPYVGKENMWFSEGYASYMQWQILKQQGLYSELEIQNIYSNKIENLRDKFSSPQSCISVLNKLKKSYDYPALYWGGACYFMELNKQLKTQKNTTLMEVIKIYQNKGRVYDEGLDELIYSLDQITNGNLFSSSLESFKNQKADQMLVNF